MVDAVVRITGAAAITAVAIAAAMSARAPAGAAAAVGLAAPAIEIGESTRRAQSPVDPCARIVALLSPSGAGARPGPSSNRIFFEEPCDQSRPLGGGDAPAAAGPTSGDPGNPTDSAPGDGFPGGITGPNPSSPGGRGGGSGGAPSGATGGPIGANAIAVPCPGSTLVLVDPAAQGPAGGWTEFSIPCGEEQPQPIPLPWGERRPAPPRQEGQAVAVAATTSGPSDRAERRSPVRTVVVIENGIAIQGATRERPEQLGDLSLPVRIETAEGGTFDGTLEIPARLWVRDEAEELWRLVDVDEGADSYSWSIPVEHVLVDGGHVGRVRFPAGGAIGPFLDRIAFVHSDTRFENMSRSSAIYGALIRPITPDWVQAELDIVGPGFAVHVPRHRVDAGGERMEFLVVATGDGDGVADLWILPPPPPQAVAAGEVCPYCGRVHDPIAVPGSED